MKPFSRSHFSRVLLRMGRRRLKKVCRSGLAFTQSSVLEAKYISLTLLIVQSLNLRPPIPLSIHSSNPSVWPFYFWSLRYSKHRKKVSVNRTVMNINYQAYWWAYLRPSRHYLNWEGKTRPGVGLTGFFECQILIKEFWVSCVPRPLVLAYSAASWPAVSYIA